MIVGGDPVIEDDQRWMRRALELARHAESIGEVPVGAVLVRDGTAIGEGWNAPISGHDPTAHAEIRALRDAAARVGNYRLGGSTLYVTLEPCAMCAGSLLHARVGRLVFGADDPRGGAVRSVFRLLDPSAVNHRVEWQGGLLAEEAAAQLRAFFAARRGL